MKESSKKNIYFHVGTGKTGTTFLQYRVFPKMEGVFYIQRTKYRKAKKIINNSNYDKYFISSEFDQQLEHEVKIFAEGFPETKPIIVFRKHDGYIASQYRRFVKNGFRGNFVDFFDVENDNGFFKKKDLDYYRQIQILENHFTQKPIVLFYEDLRSDAKAFIENLSRLMNVSVDYQKINTKKKHASYSEKQLKAMQSVGKRINMRKRRVFKNGFLHFLWKIYLGTIRYSVLYIAKCIPKSSFRKETLINPKELEKLRIYYEADWKKCKEYANKNNEKQM
jgi:hypothetical protein